MSCNPCHHCGKCKPTLDLSMCQSCGKKLAADVNVCPYCGYRIPPKPGKPRAV